MYHVALIEEFQAPRSYAAAVGSTQNGVYMLAGCHMKPSYTFNY